MFVKRFIPSILLLSFFSPIHVLAATSPARILVTPTCLIKHVKETSYQTITNANNFVLITMNENGINELVAAKTQFGKECGGFIDVTQDWYKKSYFTHEQQTYFLNEQIKPTKPTRKTSYKIRYENETKQLITQIVPENMWNNLTTLTSNQDRYANSEHGVQAANWIKTQIINMAAQSNHAKDVTITTVETGFYKQPSVVAKFGNGDEPGIVIGGHMDTLDGSFSKKPGADDDGTGSVTVMEIARTLLTSGLTFKHPIYFIWYAAEEEGLVGSGHVVNYFKSKNIPVQSVMQFDMTGYAYKNDPTIWLIEDYVDKDLTKYLEKLIQTYVKQPVQYTACHYACSDHASWHNKGYAASIPFESSFHTYNPDIHSSRDTMDKLSLNHMTDYAKLGVAFAVELAEPV